MLASALLALTLQQTALSVEGVVFEDSNRNGIREARERGLGDVRVSDGRQVVRTDRTGKYRIAVDAKDAAIFVVKPTGFIAPLSATGTPRLFRLHKPAGSPKQHYAGVDPTPPLPKSLDFGLHRSPERNRFRVALLGDTQTYGDYGARAIGALAVRELATTDFQFGISLGDIVWDKLDSLESQGRTVATLGKPWWFVIGNHDLNAEATRQEDNDESFERAFGPSTWAFEYGGALFVGLHNVRYTGGGRTKPDGYQADLSYSGEIGARQLEFVRNLLIGWPKDKLVVLTMHLPLPEVRDREELLALLKGRRAFSVSAHWHVNEHFFLGNHHHMTLGAVSGGWWTSDGTDQYGLETATMADGSPMGYWIAEITPQRVAMRFKASRYPADFQISVFTVEDNPWEPKLDLPQTVSRRQVIANFFAGSSRCRLQMRVGDGPWLPMTRVQRPDPYLATNQARRNLAQGKHVAGTDYLSTGSTSTHIWVGELPEDLQPGFHIVQVQAVDVFGQVHQAKHFLVR